MDALRRCATKQGFVATPEARDNYQRVWARDGCVAVMAARELEDEQLHDAAEATLRTLAAHQGPSGQIPSNVASGHVSYGTTAGRLDATSWFIIATCSWARVRGYGFVQEHWDALIRAEAVLRAWEHNDGGLIYVPATGNWADEYPLAGHLLYDQALYVWALRELDAAGGRMGMKRSSRSELVEEAAARFVQGGDLVAGFDAGHVYHQFDAWGAALWVQLALGDDDVRGAAVARAATLTKHGLVPAFDPPIWQDDPLWPALTRAARGELRNTPGHYHNGGLWPVVTAFWANAARSVGHRALSGQWEAGIASANAQHDFPEYLAADSGEPGGPRRMLWSAAAEVIARAPALSDG